MFTIPVWELLSSYTWDSREFTFEGEIFDGYFDDLEFLRPLQFRIQIITLDDGVNVVWEYLKTTVIYEENKHIIDIDSFDRTWKRQRSQNDPDDIQEISNHQTIDLWPVIREEIIIACHAF